MQLLPHSDKCCIYGMYDGALGGGGRSVASGLFAPWGILSDLRQSQVDSCQGSDMLEPGMG